MLFDPRTRTSRVCGKLFATVAIPAMIATGVAGAQAGGGAGSEMKDMPRSPGPSAAMEKPAGTGIVNSVDQTRRKVDLSHDPIPAIQWPAMRMKFAVAPDVDLSRLRPGMKVSFTLSRGPGSTYTVQSIDPLAGR